MMPTMIIMVIPAVIGIPGKFVEDAGVIHILAAKLLRGVLWVEYRNVFTSRWVMVTRRNRIHSHSKVDRPSSGRGGGSSGRNLPLFWAVVVI